MSDLAAAPSHAHVTIRCVLFDLDGTFADTAPELAQALEQVLATRGRAAPAYEQVRAAASHGSTALIRLGLGPETDAAELEAARRELLDRYRRNIGRHTTLFPGIPELLDHLACADTPWGLVTNKPSWLTEPLLAELDLRQPPGCVVSGDTTPTLKPHPLPILHACDLLSVEPRQALYVGDAARDIEAGNRAGATTLVALFGYLSGDDRPQDWGAQGAIEHPLQVLDWLPSHA